MMNEDLERPRYLPETVADTGEIPDVGDGFWPRVYKTLYEIWGDPYWWPGQDAWEVAVGAILTQNTAWTNVEIALSVLRERGWTHPEIILQQSDDSLAVAIRSSGYYNAKARKLKALAQWWLDNADSAGQLNDNQLREELLSIWGVGPETADSIACYAFGRPLFVVDAYTLRMITRMLDLDTPPNYTSIQNEVHKCLPRHPLLLNYLHGLIVLLGKHFCKARNPDCGNCPLKKLCGMGKKS